MRNGGQGSSQSCSALVYTFQVLLKKRSVPWYLIFAFLDWPMVEDVPGFVQLGPADGSLINIHTLKLYLSSIVYVINQYIYI